VTAEEAMTLRARVDSQPIWYHTMELGAGVVTPGWFDLRPIVDQLPWPDVRGKRCLDVGTWDGFLAFEMERRGAAEVVAIDIPSHADWDHLPREREQAIAEQGAIQGTKGAGFQIAVDALGSSVRREWMSIYELSPDRLGKFDVVVCGSLLLHLRDPFAALQAVRSVCAGEFMSAEQIDAKLTLVAARRPALFIDGRQGRWMVANSAGHRRMLEISGFDILKRTRPYSVRFGVSHPNQRLPVRAQVDRALRKVATRGESDGVLHAAALCRPAL
jgi:tRNA (mo5U34)-methyltransferase